MPAAIADRTGVKYDHSSYSSKVPNHHYKPYPTRSSTNAQATRIITASSSLTTNNKHKPDLRNLKLKSGSKSSNLPLKDSTAESQYIQTSLPVEVEVPEQNNSDPVELQVEEVPRATSADPLYDIQQFYPSEHFSPNVRKIFDWTDSSKKPHGVPFEFPGVRAQEFEILEHEVGATGRVLTKPRLNMPTILHEAFYDDLKQSLTLAIHSLPYRRMTIRPQIHMNYPLQIGDKPFTPDSIVSLTATRGPTEVVHILYIGVTALTEEWDHVFEKMESMIAKHPEVILASIVLVREVKRYASPSETPSSPFVSPTTLTFGSGSFAHSTQIASAVVISRLKTSYTTIEYRYRTNLNARVQSLDAPTKHSSRARSIVRCASSKRLP
ncbi:uncharacterized protein F5891DRAFT_1195403 [Suillus fuscotomentosus]|uniref:Uncharacterized protein n=1 Tax=Suillus fuscotomentosus TaxID=1912939 RepID=A0AAD4HF65_9AGAM|nr:uncharacterized protein F5891DRAFT_1195403 [Suillus fuscotomentosus]KAG1894267.1 hypothetical protein F5891DRAFT_1195403 [Suillus fuscotomentosus]